MVGKVVGGLFAVIWIGGWTAGVIFFDYFLINGAYNQWRAEDFATITGTVTWSEVEVQSGSDGTSYKPAVRYAYVVDDRKYENDRFRYGLAQSGSKKEAEAIVAAHPVDGQVTVYYDPPDPVDSLLRPGISGAEFFLALFLTPFNLIMIGSWAFAIHAIGLCGSRDAGELQVQQRSSTPYSSDVRLHVKMPSVSPLICGAGALLGTAFVSVFVVGFTGGFDPPLALILPVWAVNLGIAGAVSLRCWRQQLTGANDLIVDQTEQLLLVPTKEKHQGKRIKGRLAIPFDAITKLKVDEKGKQRSNREAKSQHVPVVVWRDEKGEEYNTHLGDWTDHDRAVALYDWLRRQCPGV